MQIPRSTSKIPMLGSGEYQGLVRKLLVIAAIVLSVGISNLVTRFSVSLFTVVNAHVVIP